MSNEQSRIRFGVEKKVCLAFFADNFKNWNQFSNFKAL